MEEKTIDKLKKIYTEADEASKEIFAEQRSNVLLVAGEHYSKLNARIASQVRQSNKTVNAADQKLRLTKNHMHRISRSYLAIILSESPGTTISPQRENELQDKADAELNLAVWQDIKHRHKIPTKVMKWAKNYVDIGEVCVKVFWDNMAGRFLGYEPLVDEMGMPVMEETGEMDPMTGLPVTAPAQDKEKPLFSGDLVYETVPGYNLLREVGTEDMEDKDKAWIVRKMVSTEGLKARYKDDEEKYNAICDSSDRTYIVFDSNKGSYDKKKGETLYMEYYWEPCDSYPEGWFCHTTENVILEQGPLPFGLFPLKWAGFDEYQSTPRGRSILKVARPYQAEINRASSSMATAQVTMGDDKLIFSNGAKMAPGALLPGVRGIAVSGGMTPTILPGRSGAQYLEYVGAQIQELDKAVMLEDVQVIDKSGQVDPFAMLFKSATQKQKFNIYTSKFQGFLVAVTELSLEITKRYYPDDMLIPAVGARETVNIAEFRKTSPLCYQIKVEEESETLESRFGRQLTFQQILQYVGKQLDPKTIGKLAKNLPFANWKDSFDDLTIDEDIARNDMLALERGEQVQPAPFVDPVYMAKKLTGRMKTPEFKFLNPQIQAGYQQLYQQYQQINAEEQKRIQAAKNEYIPVDGALVTCDFYVPDTQNPENQAKRAKIPQRALEWLVGRLEEQGMSMDQLESMNAQALADMADMIMQGRMPQPQGGPQGRGMPLAS